MSGLPGLERRGEGRLAPQFFAGTDVEWGALIDHLEAEPPSSPAAFLAEHPTVSHEQLLVVLRDIADGMAQRDAWMAVRLALDVGARDPIAEVAYRCHREDLERRAVVEAWRDALIAAERTPEAER